MACGDLGVGPRNAVRSRALPGDWLRQVDSRTPHGPCVVVAYSPTSPSLRITLPPANNDGEGVEEGAGIDLDAAEDASQGQQVGGHVGGSIIHLFE